MTENTETKLFCRSKYLDLGTGDYKPETEEWVGPLCDWIGDRKVLELYSGCGAFGKRMKEHGVDVIMTDDGSKAELYGGRVNMDPKGDVELLTERELLDSYADEVDLLVCIWPPVGCNVGLLLRKFREINPDIRMIYVGEDFNTLKCEVSVFKHAKECGDVEFHHAVRDYSRYRGCHDRIMLLK